MNNDRQKLNELLKKSDFCMLTTMTADGHHVSRPMSMQKAEFDGDLWFLTYDNSNKANQIRIHPEVNISFSGDHYWISLSGTAEVVQDRKKAKELWNPLYNAWFPEGLETPHLALLKVHAKSAEYWESSSSKAIQLLGMVSAAITGDETKTGDNKKVEL